MSFFFRFVTWVLAGAVFPSFAVLADSDVAALHAPELTPGDRGVALTAIHGREIEEIPVRFIGTLSDYAGPGYDLHLFQLEGEVADHVGVAAGMSGSPVFVDGKLVGALSYRIGALPKDAIGGVTPIEDIVGSGRSFRVETGDSTARPIRTPIVASGLDPAVRAWAAPQLEKFGLVVTAAGAGFVGDEDANEPDPFLPGSPIGVGLMRGDLTLGATGTVTWVAGDRIYAFGHPFLGTGRTELPMHTASVIYTLADMLGSIKIAEFGPEVGAIVDDRLSAIVGRRGLHARTIPLDLIVNGGDYDSRSFHFEVVRSRFLTPILAGIAVSNALMANAGFSTEATLFASGRIRLAGLPDLTIETAYSGETGSRHALALASRLVQLMSQLNAKPFPEVNVEGVELSIDVTREIRTYSVESLVYDRGPVTPGQTFEIGCVLRRHRGDTELRRMTVQLPDDLVGHKRLMLVVGSPSRVSRALGGPTERRLATVGDLATLVDVLSDVKSANRLTATIYGAPDGIVKDGRVYSRMPASARHLLSTEGRRSATMNGAAEVLATSDTMLDGPVSGGVVVRLEIEPRVGQEDSR